MDGDGRTNANALFDAIAQTQDFSPDGNPTATQPDEDSEAALLLASLATAPIATAPSAAASSSTRGSRASPSIKLEYDPEGQPLSSQPQQLYSSLTVEGGDASGREGRTGRKRRVRDDVDGRVKSGAELRAAEPAQNPIRSSHAGERAPPMNMDTIDTESTPPDVGERTGRNRAFALDHCPVYRPTIEEFAHPFEFIERVARECEDTGIVKIIPPPEWRPDFALDTDYFRFRTRLQRINSMEASSRASVSFLEQLHHFHQARGKPDATIPIVDKRPIDLWRLRREVHRLGGFDAVSAARKWAMIARSMGYAARDGSSISTQVKSAYAKIVRPFDMYCDQLQPGEVPPGPAKPSAAGPSRMSAAEAGSSTSRVKLSGKATDTCEVCRASHRKVTRSRGCALTN